MSINQVESVFKLEEEKKKFENELKTSKKPVELDMVYDVVSIILHF